MNTMESVSNSETEERPDVSAPFPEEKNRYDRLRLENQLCFPLYACSKEIVRRYRPLLDQLDLTYTQYLVMMVLWEKSSMTVKELGQFLYLDSGTLTPLLKKLEARSYIRRVRSSTDERNLIISLTNEGLALRDQALSVPEQMSECVHLEPEEAAFLYQTLYKILGSLTQQSSRTPEEDF